MSEMAKRLRDRKAKAEMNAQVLRALRASRHMRDPVHNISDFGGDYLRQFSFQNIGPNVCSTFGAFLALMRYINSRFTYLLILLR